MGNDGFYTFDLLQHDFITKSYVMEKILLLYREQIIYAAYSYFKNNILDEKVLLTKLYYAMISMCLFI